MTDGWGTIAMSTGPAPWASNPAILTPGSRSGAPGTATAIRDQSGGVPFGGTDPA
ncbi:hypothetical protein GCM10027610_049870 [Dactylosporangium cerinum]